MDKECWVSESQFLRALNFCMILPGPEAQQLATYIGWRLHGTSGGIVAEVSYSDTLVSIGAVAGMAWRLLVFS